MKRWNAVAGLKVLLAMFALLVAGAGANAQDLEPRSYTNTPVGMKFLIAGYGYVEGSMAFDPSVPLADAQYYRDVTVLAYAQSFDAWGKSAKFDIVVPYSTFSGTRTGERAASKKSARCPGTTIRGSVFR